MVKGIYMLNLKDTTFIIPIRIESPSRAFNFRYVVQYLCDNLKTNIIIRESGIKNIAGRMLSEIDKRQTHIIYNMEYTAAHALHRTRLLNEMLAGVTTACVANYDTDIILQSEAYLQAQNRILSGEADLVYPYFKGLSQKKVTPKKGSIFDVFSAPFEMGQSDCGHCCFFNTEAYKEGGRENENFIAYAPEDQERSMRFLKLGYKVMWLNNFVWHLEHERSVNSTEKNPYFWDGMNLYKAESAMTEKELREYCCKQEYIKKYGK